MSDDVCKDEKFHVKRNCIIFLAPFFYNLYMFGRKNVVQLDDK